MFDRTSALWRDDDPTPATARPAERARPRAPDHRDARETAPPRTTGHRREHDARLPARYAMTDRKRAATADVGLYRAVSYTDLSEQHFDGHPYATRRAVDQMVRHGHIQEHEARGPDGGTYTVLRPAERRRFSRPVHEMRLRVFYRTDTEHETRSVPGG